jgi:hypothetical protein
MEPRVTPLPAQRLAWSTLAGWLDARGLPEPVLIGATGHLDLTAAEEARLARRLRDALLPDIAGRCGDAPIVVMTGVAPGADLVVAETAAAWLAQRGHRAQRLGLLPVPPEVLWEDWQRRVAGVRDGERALRQRFEGNLAACDGLIPLWTESDVPDWSDAVVRQAQYRRLGASLATQCDVLVAVLRRNHSRTGQPGGTAEVVRWRRNGVPPEFAVDAQRGRSGWRDARRLVVIDPDALADAADAEAEARAALRAGNYLQCYDLVTKAQQRGIDDDALHYIKVLALANAGNTEGALDLFARLRAARQREDEDWLALEGRLHKDLGLRGGTGAAAHLRRAADAYHAAAERTGGYFTAINAATTALLAGDPATAGALAQRVLDQLAAGAGDDEEDWYYRHASEAEAALLLGDVTRARAALTAADRLLADNINARSRTRQQLRRVCRTLALDEHCLDALRLPPVLYVPLRADAPPPALEAPAHAFAYAGLASPADLAIAEALLGQRARLHVMLAGTVAPMVRRWRERHGDAVAARLERVLGQVDNVAVARGFLAEEEAWSTACIDAMALGRSRLAARRLGCEWRALGPDGWLEGHASAAPAPTHPSTPVAAGRYGRRLGGIIFADFAGFSALPDEDLPLFWSQFMRPIGERLAAHGTDILLKHTWGDALHVITAAAATAAEVACEIQDSLERLRPQLPAGLAGLELRLSAHYGPVFSGHDPVERRATYFGTPLSFAARIEPVTPPGMIFVTEAFAAQLALEAPEAFLVEYAGEITLAKAYGQSRLFGLRRAPAPGA